MEINRTIIERGNVKCVRLRLSRKLLERIDKNYYEFGNRNALIENSIKEKLDQLEADAEKILCNCGRITRYVSYNGTKMCEECYVKNYYIRQREKEKKEKMKHD